MSVAALVLGAGRGERLGAGASKAFVSLEGRPLLAHALAALAAVPDFVSIVPVVRRGDLERCEALRRELGGRIARPVPGGCERQDSLRAGLRALGSEVELVAVHDAARPLLRSDDVARVLEAARRHGAAILAVPLRDTLKRVRDGEVVETPERSECWAAQTPQVVRRDWLAEALEKAEREGVRATDEAALVERLGVRVRVVEGDPRNLKVTVPADLQIARTWLREAGGPRRGEGA